MKRRRAIAAHRLGTAVGIGAGAALFVLLLGEASGEPQQATPDSSFAQILDDLYDPKLAWRASARARTAGPALVPALLAAVRPALLQPNARGEGAHALALAKIGAPAIPPLLDRLEQLLADVNTVQESLAEAILLVEIVATNGPVTIPALLDVAVRTTSPTLRERVLDRVVAMEPRREAFGQHLGALPFWQPQSNRLQEIDRAITPRLPALLATLERDALEWRPESSSPQRPAAYLIARWSSGAMRARALAALESLARADEPYYRNLRSAELLQRLRAPSAAALLVEIDKKLPPDDAEGYRLIIAVALYQIGDQTYAQRLLAPLNSPMVHVRTDAIAFAAATGNLEFLEPLIALLGNRTETGRQVMTSDSSTYRRQTVADVAHDALRRLTYQSLGPEAAAWTAWRQRQPTANRAELLTAWIDARRDRIREVPVDEANAWLDQLAGPLGAQVIPLLDTYLRRGNWESNRVPIRRLDDVPPVARTPTVLRLIFEMMAAGIADARALLDLALVSSSPQMRTHAALLMASIDRRVGVNVLAQELTSADPATRSIAMDGLLALGDVRGIPPLLDELDTAGATWMACQQARSYTQQAFDCGDKTSAEQHAQRMARWREWWQTSRPGFEPTVREAELDRIASNAHNVFGLAIHRAVD